MPGTDREGRDDPADGYVDADIGPTKMNHHFLKRKLMRLATRWVKTGEAYEKKETSATEKQEQARKRDERQAQRKKNQENAMMAFADPGVAAVADHTYNELLTERKRRKLAEEKLNQAPWESILRDFERPNLPNPIYHTQSTRPNPPDPAQQHDHQHG